MWPQASKSLLHFLIETEWGARARSSAYASASGIFSLWTFIAQLLNASHVWKTTTYDSKMTLDSDLQITKGTLTYNKDYGITAFPSAFDWLVRGCCHRLSFCRQRQARKAWQMSLLSDRRCWSSYPGRLSADRTSLGRLCPPWDGPSTRSRNPAMSVES